jgi:hypothetical protein
MSFTVVLGGGALYKVDVPCFKPFVSAFGRVRVTFFGDILIGSVKPTKKQQPMNEISTGQMMGCLPIRLP